MKRTGGVLDTLRAAELDLKVALQLAGRGELDHAALALEAANYALTIAKAELRHPAAATAGNRRRVARATAS